ncbi:MAG TPA: DUF6702 family protein [Ohtaekwangia sp.]
MIPISSVFAAYTFVLSLFHPLHVSVTEIEFDEKDKSLEIMMRIFIDDTELTMSNRYNKPSLDILNLKDGMTIDQMMTDYTKEHFKVTLDSKSQEARYLGHEKDGDVFILYIEVPNVKKWKSIQVMNDVFMETHEDQSNLVHVTVRGQVKSMRLTKGASVDKLTFESK